MSLRPRSAVGDQDYFGEKGYTPRSGTLPEGARMRREYDFSKMKGRRNPYARLLKKPVTIRLGADVVDYFKSMANQLGVPYQNLMNLYLRDCVQSHRHIQWVAH